MTVHLEFYLKPADYRPGEGMQQSYGDIKPKRIDTKGKPNHDPYSHVDKEDVLRRLCGEFRERRMNLDEAFLKLDLQRSNVLTRQGFIDGCKDLRVRLEE